MFYSRGAEKVAFVVVPCAEVLRVCNVIIAESERRMDASDKKFLRGYVEKVNAEQRRWWRRMFKKATPIDMESADKHYIKHRSVWGSWDLGRGKSSHYSEALAYRTVALQNKRLYFAATEWASMTEQADEWGG